ncbi:GlxA family transcriptional regulator [Streptomyces sp. C10-9-1]|uniref:GlxA family transcriptional regulator n=1 Tax=Streptomyces sp. C10-9-1 TaxID=1859285 RepID=UPI003F4A37A2
MNPAARAAPVTRAAPAAAPAARAAAPEVVAVLALDGVLPFELSLPGQVLGTANEVARAPRYEVRVCAPGRRVRTSAVHGGFALAADWDLDALAEADTVVVPAGAGSLDPPDRAVVRELTDAYDRGARLASLCVGAFTLAATGVLDGRRATTHWRYAAELSGRHPRVEVDGSVLFVEDGPVVTSAGVAAGLDLCLHLVRRDLGADRAAATARRTVMPLQREGGQAQFIEQPLPPAGEAGLGPTLVWMEENLHRLLTLDEIAAHAAVSPRTLNRRFRAGTGTAPLQWLLAARVRRARELLETTALSVEQVAVAAGFGSAVTLRHHFGRRVGTSPHAYRGAFRAGPGTAADS